MAYESLPYGSVRAGVPMEFLGVSARSRERTRTAFICLHSLLLDLSLELHREGRTVSWLRIWCWVVSLTLQEIGQQSIHQAGVAPKVTSHEMLHGFLPSHFLIMAYPHCLALSVMKVCGEVLT